MTQTEMNTKEEIHLSHINSNIDHINEVHAENVQNLTHLNKMMNEKLTTLKEKLPLIMKALDSEGLELINLHFGKGGSQSIWAEQDKLNINFNGRPISDKFKFISFAGYTSKGAGKNRNKLNTLAKKLENRFKVITDLTVDVNEFSLERSNSSDKEDRVMYQMWF